MRLCFAIGCQAIHDHRSSKAIANLEDALEIASERGDAGAFAVIAQKQAHIHYQLHSFNSAADYYQDALEAAQAYQPRDSTIERVLYFQKTEFLLELLWGLMTQHFLTADFDSANASLEEARRLARTVDQPLHRIATVEWTAALLQRWQLESLEALNTIQKTRGMYAVGHFGSTVEQARLDIVAADIGLDVAASLEPGSFVSAVLDLSKQCIRNALEVTEICEDSAGQGMALLAMMRLNRFQSQPVDRVTIIQHVLTQAIHAGDRELQCQAFTALGDEFIARGQQGDGLEAYRQALGAVASGDGIAMGKWALQRLLGAMNGMASA